MHHYSHSFCALTELANHYGSDKGTEAGARHAYTLVYAPMFEGFRKRPAELLELGLARGGPELGANVDRPVVGAPSARMWLDYFDDACITGFDISDFAQFETGRFRFVRGDLGKREDLARLADGGCRYDIVIDDGSHASYHQLLAFQELFPCVRPGGFYIVEDLDWQPPEYERTLPRTPKARDFFAAAARGQILSSEGTEADKLKRAVSACASINLVTADRLERLRAFYRDEFEGLMPTARFRNGIREMTAAVATGRLGRIKRAFASSRPKLVVIKKSDAVPAS